MHNIYKYPIFTKRKQQKPCKVTSGVAISMGRFWCSLHRGERCMPMSTFRVLHLDCLGRVDGLGVVVSWGKRELVPYV